MGNAPVSAKGMQLQAELKQGWDEIAQVLGGPDGIKLANAIEVVIGKSLELFAETVLPGILRPFLSGAIQHFGDAMIASAEKSTDAGLAKLAASNKPGP